MLALLGNCWVSSHLLSPCALPLRGPSKAHTRHTVGTHSSAVFLLHSRLAWLRTSAFLPLGVGHHLGLNPRC